MEKRKKEYPACFGILENVFPLAEDGLRNSPESCFVCHCKTECLQTALGGTDGLEIQEESIDRAYAAGMVNFWERWSRKKSLHRKKNKSKTVQQKGRNV